MAQGAKPPRIGVLMFSAAPAGASPNPYVEAFRAGLRERGYVEGQNITVEYRWAAGQEVRAMELASDLVKREVALIVSAGTPATRAAMAASHRIPIVMTAVGDPLGSGFVASLARPGGNATGLSLFDSALDGKRIELLRELVPGLTRVAMLWSPNDPGMALAYGRVESASQTLRLVLQSLPLRSPDEVGGAAAAAEAGRAQALVVTAQPFTIEHQARILETVGRMKLPAIYTDRRFVDAGGLLAYGPNLADMYQRAATYVDRILKGALPAELPVEQPTRFELVINLRTAKSMGITVPAALRARADQLIE